MKRLGVGGNLHDGVAQWIERQFAELNVAGSTPVTVAFLFLALQEKTCLEHLWPLYRFSDASKRKLLKFVG